MANNANSLWGGIKNYIYKHYGQESGKMLVHAGLITWVTSSLAQIVAVAMNDKIPPEQKKFIIPQEIADGVLNVAAFYLVTNTAKNVAVRLVSSGKWSTKGIRDFVQKHAPETKMGDLSTNLSVKFKENEEFHNCYDKFKGGMEMIAAVSGSVIASNVVTPVIRNAWGAKKQKESLAATYKTYPRNNSSMKV